MLLCVVRISMKQTLFLHYGWFLQNLGKDSVRINMHRRYRNFMIQVIFSNVKILKQVVLDTGNIEDWHSYFVESNPDQRFQISNIYINPDFRRKAQIPNLAIIKFTGDAWTKNSWTFDFVNPLWSLPLETRGFYPQDDPSEIFF